MPNHPNRNRNRLTTVELEAIIDAALNADPAMWDDEGERGDELAAAFESGIEKLRTMLAKRRER